MKVYSLYAGAWSVPTLDPKLLPEMLLRSRRQLEERPKVYQPSYDFDREMADLLTWIAGGCSDPPDGAELDGPDGYHWVDVEDLFPLDLDERENP